MYEYVIQAISKEFIFGINYVDDNYEPQYGLVTLNSKYTPTKITLPEGDFSYYTFYDLLTKKYLRLPVKNERYKFFFEELFLLNIDEVIKMLEVSDKGLISSYNETILKKFNNRKKEIELVAANLKDEYNMQFTKEEITKYISIFNTDHFRTMKDNDTYLIKLCMLFKTTPLKILNKNPDKIDLDIAKKQWLTIINKYITLAKSKLDEELDKVDPLIVGREEYKYEEEEVQIIKKLIDDIPGEFEEDLNECNNYEEILEAWPPLLLPAPQYIIDQPSGMNALEKMHNKIDYELLK